MGIPLETRQVDKHTIEQVVLRDDGKLERHINKGYGAGAVTVGGVTVEYANVSSSHVELIREGVE